MWLKLSNVAQKKNKKKQQNDKKKNPTWPLPIFLDLTFTYPWNWLQPWASPSHTLTPLTQPPPHLCMRHWALLRCFYLHSSLYDP